MVDPGRGAVSGIGVRPAASPSRAPSAIAAPSTSAAGAGTPSARGTSVARLRMLRTLLTAAAVMVIATMVAPSHAATMRLVLIMPIVCRNAPAVVITVG